MEKTKEEIIVEIFRQFTPSNKRNFMTMLRVAVNAENSMRKSIESEQAAKVFANRQDFGE
ncbi:MAG: hypothetical protein E7244_20675 [Enterocloster citroniae]|nr:hypothetical protein [Enterocloster citroniae]